MGVRDGISVFISFLLPSQAFLSCRSPGIAISVRSSISHRAASQTIYDVAGTVHTVGLLLAEAQPGTPFRPPKGVHRILIGRSPATQIAQYGGRGCQGNSRRRSTGESGGMAAKLGVTGLNPQVEVAQAAVCCAAEGD